MLYPLNPSSAHTLLTRLVKKEPDVQNAIIELISLLINQDWETGFPYPEKGLKNDNRFVRRFVVRLELHYLMDASTEWPVDRHQKIFSLLLDAALDKGSEWVRQEAAYTLAHYLDQHQGNFIVYVNQCMVKNLHPHVWKQVAYKTTSPIVRSYINAVIPLLFDLDQSNVPESSSIWCRLSALPNTSSTAKIFS